MHKLLPTRQVLHREKMNNPFSSGTADVWYSGDLADWWVEYKYLTKLPVRAMVLADLSPLQSDWLDGRHREGRNVAVVVGSPEGAVIYLDRAWLQPITPDEFRSRMISKRDLAAWLVSRTLRSASTFETPTPVVKRGRRRT